MSRKGTDPVLVSHTGRAKIFLCPEADCGKCFTTNWSRSRHLQSIHGKSKDAIMLKTSTKAPSPTSHHSAFVPPYSSGPRPQGPRHTPGYIPAHPHQVMPLPMHSGPVVVKENPSIGSHFDSPPVAHGHGSQGAHYVKPEQGGRISDHLPLFTNLGDPSRSHDIILTPSKRRRDESLTIDDSNPNNMGPYRTPPRSPVSTPDSSAKKSRLSLDIAFESPSQATIEKYGPITPNTKMAAQALALITAGGR
eukprot:Rmarinus@m.18353